MDRPEEVPKMSYEEKSFKKMEAAEQAHAVGAPNLMWLRIAYAVVYALNNVAAAIRESPDRA